jgi:hypothetical protein
LISPQSQRINADEKLSKGFWCCRLMINPALLPIVFDLAALCLHPYVLHPGPTPLFNFLLQTKAVAPFDPWASLASRLDGPWATLGPPQGPPNPKPNKAAQRETEAPAKPAFGLVG